MTVTRFVVSPAVLGGLAGLVPGEKSPLSPLHIPNPPELTPEQHASLFEIGMLDQNGLVEPARLMLAALSETPSFARIRLNAPAGYLDEAIHFTGEGAYSVGISNTPDGLELSLPGDSESIFSQIKEFTGSSNHEGPAWSVQLLPLEMLCLAALMDLRRQAVLHAIVDQQPVVPLPSDVQAIADSIQSMWGNPQWLTNAIQNASAIRIPPAAALVRAALYALVDKKQAWHQNENFYPIPEAIQTADRFLLIGTVIHLDIGSANMQGRFTLLRQSWLQAGITEMLNISQVKDNLRLQLVSPAAALERFHFYLTNYDAVPVPPIEDVELSIAIQAGIGAGQTFPLTEETVIGRSEQATVHILDTRASRRHAVIRKLTQGYQLTDAGSTNGTYLNEQLMTGPSWLHEGDIIAIGETQIKVIRSGDKLSGVTSDQTLFVGGSAHPMGVPRVSSSPQGDSAQTPAPPQPNPTTPQTEDSDLNGAAEIEFSAPQEPALTASDETALPLPTAVPEPAPSQEPLADAIETLEQPEAPLPMPEDELVPPVESLPQADEEPAPLQEPSPAAATQPEEDQPAVPAVFIEPEILAEASVPPQTADLEITLDLPEELVCPHCGSAVNPSARFCGTCGNHLNE